METKVRLKRRSSITKLLELGMSEEEASVAVSHKDTMMHRRSDIEILPR